MISNSKLRILDRLRRGPQARRQFVESHLAKNIGYQIRLSRELQGLTQEQLAAKAGMKQNALSRIESTQTIGLNLKTLIRLAEALDVGLIVRLAPFSQLVDWVAGVPRFEPGLTTSALGIRSFEVEERQGSTQPSKHLQGAEKPPELRDFAKIIEDTSLESRLVGQTRPPLFPMLRETALLSGTSSLLVKNINEQSKAPKAA